MIKSIDKETDILTKRYRRYRITETKIRNKSFFTVEIRSFSFLYIFNLYTEISICDTKEDAEELIKRLVSYRITLEK